MKVLLITTLCLNALITRRCSGLVATNSETKCLPIGPGNCACRLSDGGGIIDLTSLGNADGTPRFAGITDRKGNTYAYSACHGFTTGQCNNAAVCLTNHTSTLQIGDSGNALYGYSQQTGRVTVEYSSSQKGTVYVSEVELFCDANACSPTLQALGQASEGDYKFSLRTACACPDSCSATGPITGTCNASDGSHPLTRISDTLLLGIVIFIKTIV